MKFVHKSGTWPLTTGGRSDTPVLGMPNITKGNTLRVSVTFLAKMNSDSSGFQFDIKPTKASDAKALSSTTSFMSGNTGWQSTTLTAIFEAIVDTPSGVEEVDFEVVFQSNGTFDGKAEIGEFLFSGQVVTLMEP